MISQNIALKNQWSSKTERPQDLVPVIHMEVIRGFILTVQEVVFDRLLS